MMFLHRKRGCRERDLAFIWLTGGQKPRRDAFYDIKAKKLTSEVLDDLNYQFLRPETSVIKKKKNIP